MPHYQNSVIYKLKHNEDYDDTNIYVGSTTNFKHRKNEHKNNCNNEKDKHYNFFVYQYIRNNVGWENWVMIPIEQYPCNNKDELKIRERYYIDLFKSKLNKIIPGRTIKELRDDNKQIITEKQKQYRNDNKEKLKKYREDNKEKLQEYFKQYKKLKVICDHCGCEVCKKGLNVHKKTKKCINFVKKD